MHVHVARRRNWFHATPFWRLPYILSGLISGIYLASVHSSRPAELSVSFYTSVPSSLFTLAPGAARHLFIAWLPKRENNPAFRPQYRTNLPSPHHHAAALSILKSYTCSVLVQSEKRVPASRYAKPLNPSYTYPNPSSSSRKRNALCFFSFTCRPHPSAHASSTAC
jgi:hypothetical protein